MPAAPQPAPSSQARRVEKIKGVLTAIKANNWNSFNEFLLAFYSSTDPTVSAQAHRSLAYTKDKAFPPEQILDAWLAGTHGESRQQLQLTLTRKTADFVVHESSRACKDSTLQLASTTVDVESLTTNLALKRLASLFQTLLPCLWLLLISLLTATNVYERKHKTTKLGKDERAARIAVVVISMLLYGRNRATNAFQMVMGVFLSGTGASRRVIDTFNHMGLSVSYHTVQNALKTLSASASSRARRFIQAAQRLFGIVYDNINFTLRKASQRLDNMTEQLNATTSAIFALPASFTRAAYASALSIAARNTRDDKRSELTLESLMITEAKQAQLDAALKHHVRHILLAHAPGLKRRKRWTKALRRKAKQCKPAIRVMSSSKTDFYPLPALAQEEASVPGTIKVITKIFQGLLGLAEELIDAELRILVGDWLSIRNLRLVKEEVAYELSTFARMRWIQEASMPFHFQLNAIYMLYRTHLGRADDNDPGSLEQHRTLLRRSKLDPKKPEYNKARELVEHSLVARILECARIVLEFESVADLRLWKPSWEEFEAAVAQVIERYISTNAAHQALLEGDEVLAHGILFNRDAMLFREFSEAIRDADVGRMWLVYDFWVFMMRGAGCHHNYGNEILEMKAQYEHVFPPLLREVMERTWLVNRWGKKGRSIPTDLYLEHNNGFLKNMFAAMGSNASIEHVQQKSSACVEVLRDLAHDVAEFFGVNDFHRGHRTVEAHGDIMALVLDLATHKVYARTSELLEIT
ncbi:hypothetical protein LXA43DRAFT_523935 [Ganoderma leucocontextum]|nr:hypothetical protein LXA43DRAFT_523935 [Ganoderma leucocontextum]